MNDCRLNVSFAAHPKFKVLCKRLDDSAGLCLVKLWAWAAANRTSGSLAGMSDSMIELTVDWTGTEGQLVGTLTELRLLDGPAESRRIHDWETHQPYVNGAEERSHRARKGALVLALV